MRLRGTFAWCAPVLVLATVSGCGTSAGVVAEVGHRPIGATAVQAYLEAVTGLRWQAVQEKVASQLLDQYLDQEVLVLAAGRDPSEETRDPARRAAVVRRLLDDLCGSPPPPSEDAVEREIARRSTRPRPARVHVRQMLLDTEEEAAAARERVQGGESFVDVSRQVSRAPNAESGGELGFVQEGTLPPDLEKVVFNLAPQALSAPVSSPAGFHIFQVLEVIPAGPPDRAELAPVVRRELEDKIARDQVRGCVARLADDIGVVVYPEHLWFRYEGRYDKASNSA